MINVTSFLCNMFARSNRLVGNNPLGWRSLKDLRTRKSLVVIESVGANNCMNALMTHKVLVRRWWYSLPVTQSFGILNNYVPNREVNPHLNPSGSTNQCWSQKRTLRSILLRVFTLGLGATTLQRSCMPIFLPISCDSGELLRSMSTENLSPDKMWPGYIADTTHCLQLFIGPWLTEWFPVTGAKV